MAARIVTYNLIETGTELLTLQEVKDFMYVDFGDQDAQITGFIKAARRHIESNTSQTLIGKSVKVVMKVGIIGDSVTKRLPYCPFAEFTKVEYQTCLISPKKDITAELNRHLAIVGEEFPVIEFFGEGVYTFEYKAGYTGANLPHDLKTAWLNYIAAMYENRGDAVRDRTKLADTLIASHKRVGWLG